MRLKNASMLKSMGIYTLSNVINAGIPFLLLPVLTNYLTTSDYGVLSNFNAMANIMIPLVGINLMSSVQIQYLKEDVSDRDYLSSGLRIVLLLSVFFTGILYLFADDLVRITGIPIYLLYFLGIYAVFNLTIEVLLALWRMENKAQYYGIFRISRTILEVSLILIFVIGFGYDFKGSIYGMMIAYGAGSLAALGILFKKKLLFGTYNNEYVRHVIKYGVPLIPHALSGIVIMFSDKLILTYYHGLSMNGIYSVGFMVGQVIGLAQNSFNQAWVPWAFSKLKEGKEADKLRLVKITYLYFIGIIVAVLFLWLIVPFIYEFLGKEFKAGMDLVLWIALGFAFNGMYKMVSVYAFYLEKTTRIAIASFGAAIVNIILNFVLIPDYGAQGAAISTLIAMILQFIYMWIISSRLIKMPWLLR